MLPKREIDEEELTGLVDIVSSRINLFKTNESPKKREVSPKPARLKYSDDDANAFFRKLSEGECRYAEQELVETAVEQFGVSKKEAREKLQEIVKEKSILDISNTPEKYHDPFENPLLNEVNKNLVETFGRDFKGNILEIGYGFTRGPTYHSGDDKLGYIAQVTNSEGLLLRVLDRLGLRMGEAVQQDDFLFVGRFRNQEGSVIQIFPQYEKRIRQFIKKHEKIIGKKVKVDIVDSLGDYSCGINYKTPLLKGKENSY